jgi:hypothetical protein
MNLMTKTPKRRKTRRAAPATASLIKPDYRARYAADGSCGDPLSARLRKHLSTDDGLDLKALKRLALANGAWQPRYATLNPGHARLCVGNRLRALVRSGTKIVWK